MVRKTDLEAALWYYHNVIAENLGDQDLDDEDVLEKADAYDRICKKYGSLWEVPVKDFPRVV